AKWETKGLASRFKFNALLEFPDFKCPEEETFTILDRERFQAEYLKCKECTSDERARFILDSIALDGNESQMLATDGRQMYQAKGVKFPWEERLLLPALKCFPEKRMLSVGSLEMAKTDRLLVFRNGPWTYAVRHPELNFPPVEQLTFDLGDTEVLLVVSEEDANRVIELLPHLPGNEKTLSLVTLEVGERMTFLGQTCEGETESEGRLSLESSRWIGGPSEFRFNREYFIRALRNGFRVFRFSGEHKITRKGKKAHLSLILGEARPASSAYMDWEKLILERLLSDHADSLPAGSRERIKSRLEKITRCSDQPAPEPLDLLPLCLAFPATA
ncbi:MAG: hypothetical protein KC917_13800, partial [Candidatus Omnitrophica bacterium]|nr:hypothetical protein [Candidatus Omnitrophota bacterium]